MVLTGIGGAAAGGSVGHEVGPITGGCACNVAPERSTPSTLAWIALGAVVAFRRKRKN
jgi:MYXO-CTERM domain-containing protein